MRAAVSVARAGGGWEGYCSSAVLLTVERAAGRRSSDGRAAGGAIRKPGHPHPRAAATAMTRLAPAPAIELAALAEVDAPTLFSLARSRPEPSDLLIV